MTTEQKSKNLKEIALESLRLDELADQLISYFMDQTGAKAGSLLIRDRDVLIVQSASGLKANRSNHAKIPVGVGITGQAAETGKIQWIPDVSRVQNHIEGIRNSTWELAVPLNHPEGDTGVVLDLESNTTDRPDKSLRHKITDEFRSIESPLLNLAENEQLKMNQRQDTFSSVMDGQFFLNFMKSWFRENPDRRGYIYVMQLEPKLEDGEVTTFRDLKREIKSLGTQLKSLLDRHVIVTRLYGNLFSLVVPDDRTVSETELTQTVRSELSKHCTIAEMKMSQWKASEDDIDTLINNTFVSVDYSEKPSNGKSNATRLENILHTGSINLSHQPIIEADSGKTIGYEILVRGPEDSDLHSPKRLFQTAYKHQRVVSLDTLIARKTLGDYQGNPGKTLFLNVERQSLVDEEWRRVLIEMFQDCRSARTLCIEITEHGNMTDLKNPIQELKESLNSSVKFAIDDFGTGESNFQAIIDLEPDILKIDRSLIRNIHEDFGKRSLIESILNFSGTTNIQVLAEGIEESAEWNTLQELGVDWAQGYHFARPEPLSELNP